MNEKQKVIAVFDGWIVTGMWIEKDTPDYLTNLNELHRVALDVMDRLYPLLITEAAISAYCGIKDALLSRPINSEYIDLFNAVYDGIVYLNQNEK